MFTTLITKPVVALFAISLFSISFDLEEPKVKSTVACLNDIIINNYTDDAITKVIVETDSDYQDTDDIAKYETGRTIDDVSSTSYVDILVRFDYQPSVGNRNRIYDSNGIVRCELIQSGVTDYFFTGLSACEDYTVVYEAGTSCP